MMIKILYFLRVFEQFGALVQMLLTTMTGLVNFMIFFALSVGFFTVSHCMLQVTFDATSYPSVNLLIVILIETFRNSIGDADLPSYDVWTTSSL